MKPHNIIFFLLLFFISVAGTAPCHAQEKPWYKELFFVPGETNTELKENGWYTPFYAGGTFHGYAIPSLFSELVEHKSGFRVTLGYEYWRYRFALELGYTNIIGTNPMVLDIAFVPMLFKAGYEYPVYKDFGAQADLAFGWMFAKTNHYNSAIGIATNQKYHSPSSSFTFSFRLYATYTFPKYNYIKLFAGGGLDTLFEKEGAIPLPLIEAGISIKPFKMYKAITAPPPPPAPVLLIAEAEEEEPLDVEQLISIEEEIIEEPERVVLLQKEIFFEADSAVLLSKYRPVLNEAGKALKSNPESTITLKAYAAPFGTAEGQITASAARAWTCVEYLKRQYGISEDRMKIEYYGAVKISEPEDASLDDESLDDEAPETEAVKTQELKTQAAQAQEWDLHRRVELIVKGDEII